MSRPTADKNTHKNSNTQATHAQPMRNATTTHTQRNHNGPEQEPVDHINKDGEECDPHGVPLSLKRQLHGDDYYSYKPSSDYADNESSISNLLSLAAARFEWLENAAKLVDEKKLNSLTALNLCIKFAHKYSNLTESTKIFSEQGRIIIFPSQNRLAKECNVARPAISNAIRQLQNLGLICTVKQGKGRTNCNEYELIIKGNAQRTRKGNAQRTQNSNYGKEGRPPVRGRGRPSSAPKKFKKVRKESLTPEDDRTQEYVNDWSLEEQPTEHQLEQRRLQSDKD